MSEFNKNLYMVKGIFVQDETEPIVTGFYYIDDHGRHFIIDIWVWARKGAEVRQGV